MKNKIPALIFVQTSQQDNHKQPSNRKKMAISGSIVKMKQFRKIKLRLWSHVDEYCENTTVHGLRYFFMQNLHFIERIWWIISVSCSMVACCILIIESYKKWKENPVIVTFSEKLTPISMIPFPAVTICSETKSQKSIFNYHDTLQKVTKDPPFYGLSKKQSKLAAAQFQICDPEINNNDKGIGKNFVDESIFDMIREVAPNKSQTIRSCRFGSHYFDCEDIFQEIMTGEGLCFTFNSLTSDALFTNNENYRMIVARNVSKLLARWTLEDGYEYDIKAKNSDIYPYRALSSGSRDGLEVIVATNKKDLDYACRGPKQGLKVILHSPTDLPHVNGQYFRIQIGQDVRMALAPRIIKTTESLKDYHPNRRQCYFNSERKLRYLKTYTQRNCVLECLVNLTLTKCGCVKFSMPHASNIPICGLAKMKCYTSVTINLLEEPNNADGSSLYINKCGCLPACTEISYDAEISQSEYEWVNYLTALNLTSLNLTSEDRIAGSQFASLSIFFKDSQFLTAKRSELIGLTDFVSTCGGLLGLFMGVSLLSIVEFVYYFSLRLLCRLRTNKIQKRSNDISKPIVRQNWRTSKHLVPSDSISTSPTWYIRQ